MDALESYDLTAYDTREELESELYESLWVDDSVTGNGSGSYTFCRNTSREYVIDNLDLLEEMANEFGISYNTIGEKFINGAWEYFDVSIRCYLLGQAISEVLDELEVQ